MTLAFSIVLTGFFAAAGADAGRALRIRARARGAIALVWIVGWTILGAMVGADLALGLTWMVTS